MYLDAVNHKALILLRGLPGSGKTTLAQLLSEDGKYPIYSVDDYFTHPETGEYTFKHDENHLAYQRCQDNVKHSMQKGEQKIVVHNTFTMDWEMEPYFKMAKEFSYELHVVTVENYHGQKNIHDLPDEQLRKMADKYQVQLWNDPNKHP